MKRDRGFVEGQFEVSIQRSKQTPLTIEDMIEKLEKIKSQYGNLNLCFANEDMIVTLENKDLLLEIVNSRNYMFSIGLNAERYLSLCII